jgi:Pin2-interacting protein X1
MKILGVGFNKNDYDNVWLDHQDDYEQLLGSLNKSNGGAKKSSESTAEKLEDEKSSLQSLEQRSMQSKARVHYKKFTRSKDLTNATTNDLNCILGHKKRKQLQEEENGVDANGTLPNDEDNFDDGLGRVSFKLNEETTTTSKSNDKHDDNESSISKMFNTNKMSIGDYFKLKMEQKNNSSKTSISYSSKHTESLNEDQDYDENQNGFAEEYEEEEQAELKKKKKKKKKSSSREAEVEQQVTEEAVVEEAPIEDDTEEKVVKKKKKKSKKSGRDEEETTESTQNGNEVIRSVSIDAIQTTRVIEQEAEQLSKADEKRVNNLELDQLESKIKDSFKGSNLTNVLGYSSYVINASLEEQLREKARRASKKRIVVEKNLEIDANFYNMSKKKKC